ncbi:hypothetical protein B296_00017949 [Ensete ventricosum]|uniref:Uncharacterized protein n=1 Tax=Ensete ventricosum TaxID=4639 RepID=A0A427B4C4_ENSVE|nr:hypothetical protein B296_00017949 [Ensete ventricosum]
MPPALTAAQRSMPFPVRIADVSGFESCPTAPEIAADTSTYQMGKHSNTVRQTAHCPLLRENRIRAYLVVGELGEVFHSEA